MTHISGLVDTCCWMSLSIDDHHQHQDDVLEQKIEALETKYSYKDHSEALRVGNWIEVNGALYRVNIRNMHGGGKGLRMDGDPVQSRQIVGIGGGNQLKVLHLRHPDSTASNPMSRTRYVISLTERGRACEPVTQLDLFPDDPEWY